MACAEGAAALQRQQTLHSTVTRESRELETSLASARHRASMAEKEAQASRTDLEVQFGVLRTELQAQSAACAESASQRTARELESAELASATERLTSELEADEAVGVELESVLAAVRKEIDVEGRELWAEESEESKLAMEAAASKRWEDELRAELAVEASERRKSVAWPRRCCSSAAKLPRRQMRRCEVATVRSLSHGFPRELWRRVMASWPSRSDPAHSCARRWASDWQMCMTRFARPKPPMHTPCWSCVRSDVNIGYSMHKLQKRTRADVHVFPVLQCRPLMHL